MGRVRMRPRLTLAHPSRVSCLMGGPNQGSSAPRSHASPPHFGAPLARFVPHSGPQLQLQRAAFAFVPASRCRTPLTCFVLHGEPKLQFQWVTCACVPASLWCTPHTFRASQGAQTTAPFGRVRRRPRLTLARPSHVSCPIGSPNYGSSGPRSHASPPDFGAPLARFVPNSELQLGLQWAAFACVPAPLCRTPLTFRAS